MKRLFFFVLTSFITITAHATEGEVLAKQWACLGCHSIQHIGISYPPAFAKVAEKYKDNPDQIKYSIRYGKGKMPAHSSLSEKEITILTEWILTLQ